LADLLPVELPHQRRSGRREFRVAPVVTTTSPLSEWGISTFGQGGYRSYEADESIRLAYYQNVYVWACAQAIAEDISALNFRAGPDPEDMEDFVPNAPLAKLLGQPSKASPGGPLPKISAKVWWEWTIVQLLITGRFSHEIVGEGEAMQLWPIPATRLTPVASRTAGEWFSHFTYGGWGTETAQLRPEQVFFHWRPSADDFRRPQSTLAAARLDVSVAVMQDRYDYAFLRNDARPASVVVYEQFAVAAENDAFQGKFLADHQGVDNAGKPIFVQTAPDGAPAKEAIAITPLGLSQRDAEFIQRHEQKIRSIIVAFGVPMSRLGDSSERTFSNAGQEFFNYYKKLKTICRELQEAVNVDVAPRVGTEYGFFDTQPLDEAIEEAKVQAVGLTDAVKTRIMWINEARAHLGLQAVDDGDRFLTDTELGLLQGAANTITVQTLAPPPAESLPPGPSAEAPSGSPPEPPPTEDRTPQLTHLETRTREELRTAAYTRRTRRVMLHEAQMEGAMSRLLERQLATTLSRLQGKRGRQALRTGEVREPAASAPASELFDEAFWVKETADTMRPIFQAIFHDAANSMLEDLGDTNVFNVDDPLAHQFIERRANQLAGNVTDTTYKAVQQALQDGVAEGESIPKLADRIRHLFEETYKHRAETVARTEVLSAYNGSTMATGMALPTDVVAGFEWLATPGHRTRPAHAAADGQVITTGDTFSVGGSSMRYPGDPAAPPGLTVNCRCTLLTLTPAEYAERSGGHAAGAHSTVVRGAYRFISQETAIDTVLSRAVRNPPPEDGWTPRGRLPFVMRESRGDKSGHAFHGNQHTGGAGGAGAAPDDGPIMAYAKGNAVRNEAVANVNMARTAGDAEQFRTLGRYVNYGHETINRSLIKGKPNDDARAMLDLHKNYGTNTTDTLTLDRGVSCKHGAELKKLSEGAEVSYKNFISTTYNQWQPDTASPVSKFAKGNDAVVMRVHLPAGSRVLPGHAKEDEIILHPGTMKVTGVTNAPGATIVHMTYTGQSALPAAKKGFFHRAAEREQRGDLGGHSFHGNQHTGGKGGGHSSLKVMGNVVIGPGGPQTAKEYAFALRTAGYKGPLSYPKGKLKELYDVHVKGSTESVNVGHHGGTAAPGTKAAPAASHKGVDYEHKMASDYGKQGDIKVTPTGQVLYHNGVGFITAGPGTTAAFQGKPSGKYTPIGATATKATGAKIAGKAIPGNTPIGTSVKKLVHEVDASTSHDVGLANWKTGYVTQKNAAENGSAGAKAIQHYSGSGSTAINESMRLGVPTAGAKAMQKYIETSGHQLTAKITVDRGVNGKHAQDLQSLKAGTEIAYKNFASTTFAQVAAGHHSVASGFSGGNVILRITVPQGTRVGIGTHGASMKGPGSEKELILLPGKMRVSHVSTNVAGINTYSNSLGTIIHMEYLG
jgi:HK97 family phage portal protein